MDRVTLHELQRLASEKQPHCVSIYLPTYRAGRDSAQGAIRLKNLVERAEQQAIAGGMRRAAARDRLEPARGLLDDGAFWANQTDGLALFLSGDGMRRFWLTRACGEWVHVGPRFYLLPLIPLVLEDARFYLLAMSPKRIRLLEATRYTVQELEVPSMPRDFQDLRQLIEEEEQIRFHTAAPPAAHFHGRGAHRGQGVGTDESVQRVRLFEYCQWINRAAGRVLADRRDPLVLACDVAMVGLYQQANQYPYLVEDYVPGNPDGRKAEQLRDQAWALVAPRLAASKAMALETLGMAHSRARASTRPEQVLAAAHHGHVDTLLVAEGAQLWGRLDAQPTAAIHRPAQPGDEELINAAAIFTYTARGDVFVYPPAQLPEGIPMAAVLRY